MPVTVPVKAGLVNIVALDSLVTFCKLINDLLNPIKEVTEAKLRVPENSALSLGAFNAIELVILVEKLLSLPNAAANSLIVLRASDAPSTN